MAHGFEKARGRDAAKDTVAVLGDSTFFHSGITGLINMNYNQSAGTVIVLDNRITGMTGHQDNPSTGKNAKGEAAPAIDIAGIARACGVKHVTEVDPFDLEAVEKAVKEETAREELSVIITKRPCALIVKQPDIPHKVTDVRISEEQVYSPLIEEGGADVIIAFEELEAYRWISYLKKDGAIFVNAQQIKPMPVILGAAEYPEDAVGFLEEHANKVVCLDALGIAEGCGSAKAVNTVLLGAVARELPFSKESWLKQIEETVKPKFIDLNKEAFEKGYQA